MKINVLNQAGKEAGETVLPKEIFEVPLNRDLVYQVATSYLSNKRQSTAKAKGRGEVRGGGRKPWRQKGTGRARQGSIRSPLWKGGGVVFAINPERNYKKGLNGKMRQEAVLCVLSQKIKEGNIIVLDELKFDELKTKELVKVIKAVLPEKKGSILLGLPKYDRNIVLMARNISGLSVASVKEMNALDLLNSRYLLLTEPAIKALKEKFAK